MEKELPDEIMALINTLFSAYGGKDFALLKSVYGDDVVIVDGFSPFRWTGPNALDSWWADVKAWVKAGGVEHEHLAFEKVRAWGASGERAYVSMSATLTISLVTGDPIVRPGILTTTYARRSGVWKAEGHTWGRLS